MDIFHNKIDRKRYVIATYFLQSKTSLRDAAWSLAIGQSVGNPNVRNGWESEELFERHACIIEGDESRLSSLSSGKVRVGFPVVNLDFQTDGISHLLCQVMGGQMDIDIIEKCHLLDLSFPKGIEKRHFLKPKYGIKGIREYTGCHGKPLLGGIVKPKIGIDSKTLLSMVKEMVEAGVNFIKEDEIMSNPACCPIEERVPLIMEYLKDKNVVYAVCINCDPAHLIKRVRKVHTLGGNAVHINLWSGLGSYKSVRDLDLPLFIHFQKSGDRVMTNRNHDYHISWKVICDLAGLMGVDFIHAGMWGGYMSDSEKDLRDVMRTLQDRNVLPALSCGMHPGLVQAINQRFGIDYMANVGGALHGHPGGTSHGVKAMRQAIDGDHSEEYDVAIDKWGLVE